MSRLVGILFLAIGTLHVASATRADDGPSAGQTVYLTVREPEVAGPAGGIAPMGMRELVRQAFLVAARDELGLSTRDVMLREDFPDKPDEKSAPFELFCRTLDANDDREIEYVLTRQGSPDKVLWRWIFTAETTQPLGALANKVELLSRRELKDVLVRAGYKGKVTAARVSSDVPSAAYDLLFTWNEISVIAGLRQLHAEIRAKGESPELLAALAVGYANLGSLTEYYYSGACKAYYARALLYEERLSHWTKDSPWSLWNSAYVATQIGLHSLGLEALEDSKKKQGASPPEKPLPFFANVIEAFGQGDLQRMVKVAKTPPERRLAGYLNWQAVVFGHLNDLTLQALQDFIRECPDSPRAYDSLAASGELGPSRMAAESAFSVTGAFLRKRLLDVAGLPEAAAKRVRDSGKTQDIAEEIEFRKGVVADLKKAGAPGVDRGEPSLSALGHTIEEIDFAQLMRRLEINRNKLSVPVDDIIESMDPLCAAHPYAAYIKAFSQSKPERESAAALLVNKLQLFAVRIKERSLLSWLYQITPTGRLHDWYQVPGMHSDMIFVDQMRCIQAGLYGAPDDAKYNAPSMRRCWEVSKKLPLAVAMRIVRDWAHAKTEVKTYERDYVSDPTVMGALADRYYALKRYDDAERCAKRQVEIHPGYPSYRLLAAVYKAKKDHVKWKETLDKAIELPSAGLEQAQLQNQIALDFMSRNEWNEAVTYADAAAESYSGWSMMTAARCHEMLGEWKKSEQLVRAVSERYDNSTFEWMYWCHRTGRGDIRAADEFTRTKIEALGTALYPEQYRNIGHYYLLTGEPLKALLLYKRAYEKAHDPFTGLHAALAADRSGKTADRDALFQQILDTKPPDNPVEARKIDYYKQLVRQLRDMLPPKGEKEINLPEVENILKVAAPKDLAASTLPYFVGVFLKDRGDLETAKTYLIRCAESKDWQKVNNALACQLLRELKAEVPPNVDRPKKTEPAKTPADKKPKGS